MPSCVRVADVLLLFLIAQTTQAGPVRRAERLSVDSTLTSWPSIINTRHSLRRDWNTTSIAFTTSSLAVKSSIASDPADATTSVLSVTAQEEQDGATPTPIFVTLDGTTTSAPAASQPATTPEGQATSTTPAQSNSTPESQSMPKTASGPALLPPISSTISLQPHLTSGLQNGSSLYPGNTASASVPLSPPEGSSSAATQTAPLRSSVSFAFPVPGETTTTTTAVAEQSGASSTLTSVLSSTANIEVPSPPASSTTIAAAPTTASPVETSTETSSVPLITSTTVRLSTLSSTLHVTGTPNNQVPTIRTSIPAASATISPEVAANNLASAKTFNTLFASLTEQSACAAGQIACVKGNVGICSSDGAFAIQSCGTGTLCFALPMSTTEGVIVGCYDPKVASGILGTPVPGSSTSASEVASEITTTITPTIIGTYTVSIIPPAASPQKSSAVQAPGFTTTVVVTKTIEPVPAPSSTTTEENSLPTTSTSRRHTRTSTAESSPVSTTAETTRQATPSKPAPVSTTSSSTGTFTDTLIVNPIPTDEPSEPPTDLVAGSTPSASPPVSNNASQGTPTVTVFVTVTQKERETVTVTVTKG
ncbi:hypothetical protein CSUB01_01629 [Colletotrichum sublineola]|uniref:Carbohydrate-binding module family 19 protein n=1 Tax=Colletotrichum sublineola TaxID=1173701 RepID=A0A066Y0B3_COLSU|nr:hypothetical protein CSUB01_01629 [Colletotrichum sublineola]